MVFGAAVDSITIVSIYEIFILDSIDRGWGGDWAVIGFYFPVVDDGWVDCDVCVNLF